MQLGKFCNSKLLWMPDNLKKEIGHFNVFPLVTPGGAKVNCQPYNRKGFYKISLINGRTKLNYADKTIEFERSGLLFSNPQTPYAWEHSGEDQSGFFCVFSEDFFYQFGHINEYPVFKPGNVPLFELSDEQVERISGIYKKMMDEIASDFTYKYDVLRNLVFELIHSALKMEPVVAQQYTDSNGAVRVSSLFTELLERQFPIESPGQRIKLRHPVEFAYQLSVHVNYLNRSLKKVTGNTTSEMIAVRIIQEARALLKHTDWNISEIAWCLGFEESAHFINFFKKNEQLTPNTFRKIQSI